MSSDGRGDSISGLNAADTLTGAEIVPLTQSTVTRRTTLQLIADWIIQTAASFAQSGSGASATTVEEELRYFVRPEQFGATGDGTTDDTTALQAALNTGKRVLIGEKTYAYATGLTYTANNQAIYGHGGASILKYTGAAIALSFNAKQHCAVKDLQLQAASATKAIYIGAVAHWGKVTGCDIRGSSTGSDVAGTVSSGNGVEIETSFYVEVSGNDISYFTKGVYGTNQCNGNFVDINSIRHCKTGVMIDDTTANSDGCSIIGNEIENGNETGSIAGVDLKGGSNHMVAHNRIEYSTAGTAHIYVHEGAAAAQRHGIIDNHCDGDRVSVKFGDNSGANKVQTCKLIGGYYAVSVTVGVDCDWCEIDINNRDMAGGATGLLTDNSVSTILSFKDDQTFACGITGLTTSPTASFLYTINKSVVTVRGATLNGTSNTIECTLTDFPALIRPTAAVQAALVSLQNNGAYSVGTIQVQTDGTAILSLSALPGTTGSFTNSGSKGFIASTFSYPRH